ncbi:MFS transporter [Neomegalonema sp.]|uniref:MFS transporter n=1 Tax=Neomegalonema sp. TaxID=2039713 RepID=UPI002615871F|nr:MFS transporter [Neomegalonema sp.]MDD2870318.1 MFS transporter [Neomegalonema sp.]
MFNRNLTLIWAGNLLLGAATPMLLLLAGFAGVWLAPSPLFATAPIAAQALAGVLTATPMSLLMGRHGRQAGFLLGAALMTLGGALGAAALLRQDFLLLCFAHALLGGGLACANFFRFAAAETVATIRQAAAMSLTAASGVGAAFLGPELFARVHDGLAPTPFAGGYLAVALLGSLGALPILALRLPAPVRSGASGGIMTGLRLSGRDPRISSAIGTAAVVQMLMMFGMAAAPMAMIGCGFGEGQAAEVMRWHAAAMCVAGLAAAPLMRRFGPERVAAFGLATQILSGAIGATDPALAHVHLTMILLGAGWSFGFLGAGQMLMEAASPEERPLAQGINETAVGLAGAGASLLSGAAASAAADWGWLTALPPLALGLTALTLLSLGRRGLPERAPDRLERRLG